EIEIKEKEQQGILDNKGNVLARSIKVYNLILDPKMIYAYSDDRYLHPTLDALVEVYGLKKNEILDLIKDKKSSQYIRLLRKISSDEKDNFEKYEEEKNRQYIDEKSNYRIKGVWFEEEYKRVYAFDKMFSNVLGFVNDEGSPVMGLELYYDNNLRGTDGRSFGYLDENRDLTNVYHDAIDGCNLYTTLDLDIQRVIEEKIELWENEDIGSKRASVIVMDPRDGSILAMASNNAFDLNNPRDLSMYDEEELKENKENLLYRNWSNDCVQFSYEPGSTSKIFTVAGALEEHAVDENTVFECKGNINLDDGEHKWTIKCNNRSGHGKLDVAESLVQSCNMCMSEMAELMGIDNFVKYQEIFGFGRKTDIDLPSEVDTGKLIYDEDTMGRTALATNAIGQNYNCSMIQMISAYASVINGGNYYVPHIMKKIENQSGKIIKEYNDKSIRKTVSKETSNFIKNALYDTVEKGTGRTARVKGIEIGGKTGTAEKLPREDKNYLVSFCGFYPVDNPEKLVYVIIDEPHLEGEAQANAKYACQLFKNIVEEIR
ncbi:MAG: penicillin-binding protein 2, partial [Lachnospiraceae bacterium]|nr:penicillin-binding protein 2 [Lachnospiraceae bacterium]